MYGQWQLTKAIDKQNKLNNDLCFNHALAKFYQLQVYFSP